MSHPSPLTLMLLKPLSGYVPLLYSTLFKFFLSTFEPGPCSLSGFLSVNVRAVGVFLPLIYVCVFGQVHLCGTVCMRVRLFTVTGLTTSAESILSALTFQLGFIIL